MKKWIGLSSLVLFSLIILRPFATPSTSSARTQLVITIQPSQSISITSPFMVIQPEEVKEDGKVILKGQITNSLAISTNTNSQLRVSLLDSNFRAEDRLKIWMTPFPNSQSAQLYLWDGWQEAFQEQLATNIPSGSNTTSFFIEYTGQPEQKEIQLEGTLEILIFAS